MHEEVAPTLAEVGTISWSGRTGGWIAGTFDTGRELLCSLQGRAGSR